MFTFPSNNQPCILNLYIKLTGIIRNNVLHETLCPEDVFVDIRSLFFIQVSVLLLSAGLVKLRTAQCTLDPVLTGFRIIVVTKYYAALFASAVIILESPLFPAPLVYR